MLTREEAEAIKVMIRDWPSSEPEAFGTGAAQLLSSAVDRETEIEVEPPEFNSIMLGPVVKDGVLTQVKIELRDVPGFSALIPVDAAADLRDGFTYLLNVKDWDMYYKKYGWLDTMPSKNG